MVLVFYIALSAILPPAQARTHGTLDLFVCLVKPQCYGSASGPLCVVYATTSLPPQLSTTGLLPSGWFLYAPRVCFQFRCDMKLYFYFSVPRYPHDPALPYFSPSQIKLAMPLLRSVDDPRLVSIALVLWFSAANAAFSSSSSTSPG